MKAHLVIASCVIGLLTAAVSSRAVPPGYVLQGSDEFNGNALNTNYWNCKTGWRHSAYNTPAAISVTNGCLAITTYTQGGTNYTGFINTDKKIAMRFGYYEASIQFSNAPGNWSAFWLQSPYVGSARSLDNPTNGVEIDIFEHLYTDRKGKLMVNGGDTALHWNGYGANHRHSGWSSTNLGIASGFHTYGLLWTSNRYTTYVDGALFGATNYPISTALQFILLTSEVESNSWAGTVPGGGYPNSTNSQLKMLVDYVRYYARP